MKKLTAIFFIFTMLLQAMPVLHFFSDTPEVFYTLIDEEKPESKSAVKEKKADDKSLTDMYTMVQQAISISSKFAGSHCSIPASPCLPMPTPPPDVA